MADEINRGPADHLASHRWAKGTSGNPGGRPSGTGLTALLRRKLDETHNGRTIAEIVVEALIKGAIRGNAPLLRELLDRVEGRVVDRQEVSTPGGGLVINVIRRGERPPPSQGPSILIDEDTYDAL